MNKSKTKKNKIAEDLKDPGTEGKCIGVVRVSPNEPETNWKPQSERSELPPRIRQLIAAAVRVWELKRGVRMTCLPPATRSKERPVAGHRRLSTV